MSEASELALTVFWNKVWTLGNFRKESPFWNSWINFCIFLLPKPPFITLSPKTHDMTELLLKRAPSCAFCSSWEATTCRICPVEPSLWLNEAGWQIAVFSQWVICFVWENTLLQFSLSSVTTAKGKSVLFLNWYIFVGWNKHLPRVSKDHNCSNPRISGACLYEQIKVEIKTPWEMRCAGACSLGSEGLRPSSYSNRVAEASLSCHNFTPLSFPISAY